MKKDECVLLSAVANGEWARDAIRRLGIPEKRGLYLCDKWTDKGLYEYGVCSDLGWITEEGMAEVSTAQLDWEDHCRGL